MCNNITELYLLQTTKRAVTANSALALQFHMFVHHLYEEKIPEDTSRLLYKEIVTRVANTMGNSFFESQDVLERIA